MTKDRRAFPISRWHRLWRCWLALLCLLNPFVQASADTAAQVEILLSGDGAPYRQLAEAYQKALVDACGRDCPTLPVVRISHLDDWRADTPRDLLITAGNEAARLAAAHQIPATLYGLIPQVTWQTLSLTLGPDAMQASSAVFLDQPAARQLSLIKAVLPAGRQRVGALIGPESGGYADSLRSAAKDLGLTLELQRVNAWNEVGPAVRALSGRIDVLLAVPDSRVFNPNTLYGILLTSYEARIPVVGYSEALVSAGAMFGLYTSVPDMGQQLAEYTAYFLTHAGQLPAPGASRHFHVSINDNVARSLGYHLPGPDTLRRQIQFPGGPDAAAQAAK